MKTIAGIDYSMTSPAICVHRGDEWKFTNCKFYYLSGDKKLVTRTNNIFGTIMPLYNKEIPASRWDAISEWAIDKLLFTNYIAMEGYAFGAKGQVFNIGENTGVLKHKILKKNIPVEYYTPGTIKKFATTKGNAKKPQMFDAFLNETKFDMTKILKCKVDGNPISDMVDSYWICKYLFNKLNETK